MAKQSDCNKWRSINNLEEKRRLQKWLKGIFPGGQQW